MNGLVSTSNQTLSKPVSSITFTIVVDTSSSAEAFGDESASASLQLAAYGFCGWAYYVCEGSVVTQLASSKSEPSSASGTRTLTFIMKERYGGTIPAGEVSVSVSLSGRAAGLGTSRATATATIKSISSSIQP